MERHGRRKFVVNRTAATLDQIIQNCVSRNARVVITDGWTGYDHLETLGYRRVNHNQNFIAPQSFTDENGEVPVHTQTIEDVQLYEDP